VFPVKNPAVTSAAVLIGLALAVGGFAWMSSGSEEAATPDVLTPKPGDAVTFVPLSPREQRKKNNLEQTKRELHKIRETGEEVSPGVFKITDATGDATYYYGDLIPGKGRDGEPMYLSVQFKRLPAPPLKERKHPKGKIPFDPKHHDNVIKLGDGKSSQGKGGGAGGASSSSGSSGGSSTGGDAGGGKSPSPK
jgi:uncharacterized membrane protein YgcG